MRSKITVLFVSASLLAGAAVGYGVAGGATDPAEARSQPASSGHPMMGQMMDAEHGRMMRDPAMRQMHRSMVRDHARMMRDPNARDQHERAMREFPEMARMMRDHHMGR